MGSTLAGSGRAPWTDLTGRDHGSIASIERAPRMFSLNDAQLALVMTAAGSLLVRRRFRSTSAKT